MSPSVIRPCRSKNTRVIADAFARSFVKRRTFSATGAIVIKLTPSPAAPLGLTERSSDRDSLNSISAMSSHFAKLRCNAPRTSLPAGIPEVGGENEEEMWIEIGPLPQRNFEPVISVTLARRLMGRIDIPATKTQNRAPRKKSRIRPDPKLSLLAVDRVATDILEIGKRDHQKKHDERKRC